MDYASILDRHQKIALQLSGGKDSIACLYLLRAYLDRIRVYWLDTGDAFPETRALIETLRPMIPHLHVITSNVKAVHAQSGIPSDIVPASSTPLGRLVGHAAPLIQDRYSCCFQTIMRPMHERMLADGITLIIRGQRGDDALKAPIRSGAVDNGIEYLFPVEHWSAQQVLDYLRAEQAPIPRFYEVLDEAPDCLSCSAWWEKGAAKYLKRYHHPAFLELQQRLDIINQAVAPHIAAFNDEVNT